jgi:hypothetical protein
LISRGLKTSLKCPVVHRLMGGGLVKAPRKMMYVINKRAPKPVSNQTAGLSKKHLGVKAVYWHIACFYSSLGYEIM